jgi:sulfopyruvate decarboxylase subunit beta
MIRNTLLKSLLPVLENTMVVSNIGIPSQELFALEDRPNHFYMLGSMGLASSIGLGLALSTSKPILAIEGDGAVLMNLGTLATIAHAAPDNYILMIVDNGSYGSTGDQATFTAGKTSLAAMAKGAGCPNVVECAGEAAPGLVQQALDRKKCAVIIVKVKPGNAKVAPIPLHPVVIRERFKAVLSG